LLIEGEAVPGHRRPAQARKRRGFRHDAEVDGGGTGVDRFSEDLVEQLGTYVAAPAGLAE